MFKENVAFPRKKFLIEITVLGELYKARINHSGHITACARLIACLKGRRASHLLLFPSSRCRTWALSCSECKIDLVHNP